MEGPALRLLNPANIVSSPWTDRDPRALTTGAFYEIGQMYAKAVGTVFHTARQLAETMAEDLAEDMAVLSQYMALRGCAT